MLVEIDPMNVTNFNRTDEELQTFMLFCILVAGKKSEARLPVLRKLLHKKPEDMTPFEYLIELSQKDDLHNTIVAAKAGPFDMTWNAVQGVLELKLKEVTVERLLKVKGIGNKTARFFVLHTQEDAECVPLDRHILSYLRNKGMLGVPDGNPTNKDYSWLEPVAISVMKSDFPGLSLARADNLVWAIQSGRLDDDF